MLENLKMGPIGLEGLLQEELEKELLEQEPSQEELDLKQQGLELGSSQVELKPNFVMVDPFYSRSQQVLAIL